MVVSLLQGAAPDRLRIESTDPFRSSSTVEQAAVKDLSAATKPSSLNSNQMAAAVIGPFLDCSCDDWEAVLCIDAADGFEDRGRHPSSFIPDR